MTEEKYQAEMSDYENEDLKKTLSPLDEYWSNFLIETQRDADDKCSGDLCFESKGFSNDEKVFTILSGKKTAMFTSFPTYSIDNEPIPVTGELYLVLDRAGNPRCVIEADSVNIIPFNEVTWEMAKKEGEDENFDLWKTKMTEYLEDDSEVVGYKFRPDIRLVYMTFHVVYPLKK